MVGVSISSARQEKEKEKPRTNKKSKTKKRQGKNEGWIDRGMGSRWTEFASHARKEGHCLQCTIKKIVKLFWQ